MDKIERIRDLLAKKAEIDAELEAIRDEDKAVRAAFAAARKPRKSRKKQGSLPLGVE